MSTDLVTADEISSTAQPVASQDGPDSALAIGTTRVAVNATAAAYRPLQVLNEEGNVILAAYVGSGDAGNFRVYDAGGNLVVQIAGGSSNSYLNNGADVGIGTSSPGAKLDVNGTLRASGQITLSGLEPASSAPTSANLETVFVDTETGILYYQ